MIALFALLSFFSSSAVLCASLPPPPAGLDVRGVGRRHPRFCGPCITATHKSITSENLCQTSAIIFGGVAHTALPTRCVIQIEIMHASARCFLAASLINARPDSHSRLSHPFRLRPTRNLARCLSSFLSSCMRLQSLLRRWPAFLAFHWAGRSLGQVGLGRLPLGLNGPSCPALG